MALSEDEQRALERIERALAADDPTFVAMIGRARHPVRSRLIACGAAFLLGVVLLVSGLVTTHASIVIGVLIALTGVVLMTTSAALLAHHSTPQR